MNPLNQNLLLNERLSKLETKLILIDHGLCPDWIRPEHVRMRDTMYLILGGEGKISVNGTTLHPRRNDLVLLPRNSRVSLYAKSEQAGRTAFKDGSHLRLHHENGPAATGHPDAGKRKRPGVPDRIRPVCA